MNLGFLFTFILATFQVSSELVAQTDLSIPLTDANPDKVCQGQKFYDRFGDLQTGTRICSQNDLDNMIGKMLDRYEIDGVKGKIPTCSAEGQTDCLVEGAFRAVNTQGLAGKIISGASVAGVAGDVTLPAANQVQSGVGFGVSGTEYTGSSAGSPNCSAANQLYCKSNSNFPSMDMTAGSGVTLTSSNFNNSIRTSGIFTFWDSSGQRHTATGDSDLISSNLVTGNNIFGANGSESLETHSNCGADGQLSCVTHSSFPAMATAGAANKILSGQTLGGVNGNISLPTQSSVRSGTNYGVGGSSLTGTLADCSADGQSGCISNSSFTAGAVSGAADKIRTGQTLAGVSGNVTLPLANQVAQGVQFGINGTQFTGTVILESHVDCSSDGQTNCVSIANYKAADISGAANKILSGQTLAGVSGNITLPNPNDVRSTESYGASNATSGSINNCSVDGGTGCTAVPAYPATLTTGAASKIVSGASLGGIAGNISLPSIAQVSSGTSYGASGTQFTGSASVETHVDCSSDGSISCVTTSSFAATATTGAANKILSGQALAGVNGNVTLPSATDVRSSVNYGVSGATSGTINDCSSDGASACVAIAAYPAALTTGAANKILSGQTLAGINGNVTLPSATDVRSSINYGVSGATSGTINDCSSDGASACVTTASYAATQISGAADKLALGQTLAGIAGNVTVPTQAQVASGSGYGEGGTQFTGSLNVESHADCSADGAVGCISIATYKAADITNAANKILSGQTLAGVSGNVTLPAQAQVRSGVGYGVSGTSQTGSMADCSSNGQDNCYVNSSSSYDAANFTNLSVGRVKRGINIAGVTGQYPSSAYPLERYSDSGATTNTTGSDETDLTSFATQLVNNASFEYWDSSGIRRTGSGDADILSSNVLAGVAFENLSMTGTASSLARPAGLTAEVPGSTQIKVSWSSVSADGYLLIARSGSAVSFIPTDGVNYATGPQGADTIIYKGTATEFDHSSLTPGNTYHYKLYTYDSSNNYTSSPASHSQVLQTDCSGLAGGTWVLVPGDSDYGTPDFCVMKYEAKNSAASPESTAAGNPVTDLWLTKSQQSCKSLGPGYTLISNEQWMTIGVNIASQASNWSSGTVGVGNIYGGHSDSNPNSLCPASTDDSLAFVEGSCTPIGSGGGEDNEDFERRTHTLSNGEVIWDMAGNAEEWVWYLDETGPVTPNSWKEFYELVDGTNMLVRDLRPLNSEKSFWDDSWGRAQGGGMVFNGNTSFYGTIRRGGYYTRDDIAGIFAATTGSIVWLDDVRLGYRCVYNYIQ